MVTYQVNIFRHVKVWSNDERQHEKDKEDESSHEPHQDHVPEILARLVIVL
jgi:hypothetical protein